MTMSKGLFVTGTGTDVGKTYVTGLIVKKLRESGASAGYYKAAMSGNARDEAGNLLPGDALQVKRMSGTNQSVESMCPYVYEHAVSPHLAARMEGNPVELEQVVKGYMAVCRDWDFVTVEGSGGFLCPLRFDGRQLMLEDVVRICHLGCLLVADAGLGVLNSVGLTAFYLHRVGIPLRGIVLNRFRPDDPMHQDNRAMCRLMAQTPVVACVQEGDQDLDIDLELLRGLYQ